MAVIKDRLTADLKTAMKGGNVTARETIRFTLAALKNAEIEKRSPMTEAEELEVLKVQTKRRIDAIDQFRTAGRDDLVQRETDQLDVLKQYMPAELSDEELDELVTSVISETGATSPRDMGKVMPAALERAGDRVNGKRLSEAVRRALAG
jgi:uncharacterized protein YqeY